jgi:ribonuclease HI
LIQQHCQYWIFNSTPHSQSTQLPDDLVPIDIIKEIPGGIGTKMALPMTQSKTIQENRTEWFQQTKGNLNQLVGEIALLHDPEEMQQLFTETTHVEIASDGGHDPTSGKSSFGWVISANKQLLAKGWGPAQSHPLLAESFQAEGYGIASALVFVHNLSNQLNISPNHHKWMIYLDNKVLIQCIEGYITNIPISQWNLRADEDITKVAYSLLKKIPAQLTHVKSHQDNNKDQHLLPYLAQLNTIAD